MNLREILFEIEFRYFLKQKMHLKMLLKTVCRFVSALIHVCEEKILLFLTWEFHPCCTWGEVSK